MPRTTYEPPRHDNPADYGIDVAEARKIKLRELNRLRAIAQSRVNEGVRLKVNAEPKEKWFVEAYLEDWRNELAQIERQIGWYKQAKANDVSLEHIKENVKVKDVLDDAGIKVEANGFFKLRNEKTPSAHIVPGKNAWYDFGEAKGGSVIDLYMRIHKVDVGKAINELKRFI